MASDHPNPLCEIIIIRYKQPDLEDRCIESVRKYLDPEKHLLTIFDNGRRDINLGHLWNSLINASQATFVCLLNSDTVVEENWIERLIQAAEETNADALGPMTNHCGISFQVGEKFPGRKGVRTLSGFCLLLRKRSWEESGGFREDFPFYGQESNLMHRLEKKVLVGGVRIHHEAGGSLPEERLWERRLGPEIYQRNLRFDWKKRLLILGSAESPFPLWRGINHGLREFRREGMKALHLSIPDRLSGAFSRSVLDFNPDVTLIVSTKVKQFRNLEPLLRILPGRKGLWWNDLRSAKEAGAGEIRKWFDQIFLCWRKGWGEFDVVEWKKMTRIPIHYMPQGSVLHPELQRRSQCYDSVFIGSTGDHRFHSGRLDLLRFLGTKLFNSADRDGRIEIENNSPRIYRESRYVIATSPKAPGYNSLRLYNILAYGGLVLLDSFPGVEDLFEDRRHLLIFKTPEEAWDIMAELRNSPEKREEISRAGWRLQQAKHTAGYRIMNMVANLTTGDQTFWGYYDR